MSSKRKEDAAVARAAAKNRTKRSEQTRPDAERDSGFSDASSEHLSVLDQVEADDSSSRSGGGASRTSSSQLAVVGGFSPNLSPMIIMNNVLLKQPGDAAPAALKPWGFSPGGVEVVQPPQVPQVVFLQPVVSARSTTPHARSASEPSSKRKRHRKYLPILKAYPKIAPHPGDSSPHTSSSSSSCSSSSFSSSSSSSSSSCSSVSVASSMKSSCSLTSVHQGRYSRDMLGGSGGGSISGSSTPCSSMPSSPLPHAFTERSPTSLFSRSLSLPATTAGQKSTDSRTQESSTADSLSTTNNSSSSSNSSSSCSPVQDSSSNSSTGNHSNRSLALATLTDTISVSGGGNCRDNSIALAESDALATGDDDDDDEAGSNKRKRFCNTYNILSKSGLLDITLRTKELIRQNRRTQGDLEKLRSHTALFMEVLRSGDSAGLLRLQTCMEEDQGGDKRMA